MPEFMLTIAGQKYRADIASIAHSLRVIAEEMVKARQEREASNAGK